MNANLKMNGLTESLGVADTVEVVATQDAASILGAQSRWPKFIYLVWYKYED